MPQFLRETFGLIYAPVLIPLVRIAWILIIGLVVLKVIDSGLKHLRLLIPGSDRMGVARVEQRTETLRLVIRSVTKAVLILLVVLTISAELGFNIGPVLASAGIVGLAVGFGAQAYVAIIAGAVAFAATEGLIYRTGRHYFRRFGPSIEPRFPTPKG